MAPFMKHVKTVAETECELRQVLGTHHADCEACRERALIDQVER